MISKLPEVVHVWACSADAAPHATDKANTKKTVADEERLNPLRTCKKVVRTRE